MPSMSHPAQHGHDGQPAEEIVLGVDTHKDTHVAAVITKLGMLVATAAFPTTTVGYRQGTQPRRSPPCRGGRHRFLRRGAGPLPGPA